MDDNDDTKRNIKDGQFYTPKIRKANLKKKKKPIILLIAILEVRDNKGFFNLRYKISQFIYFNL